MKLVLASANEGKIKEFKTLLAKEELKGFCGIKDLNIVENGSSFEENALIKARSVAKLCSKDTLVLADDSGLCVDALGGRPGIYSARYSLKGSDEANLIKLVNELKVLNLNEYKAYFVCALALVCEKGEFVTKGFLKGKLSLSPKGENGFGYDPIFIPAGFKLTLAQLKKEEKDEISHRKEAVMRLKEKLPELFKA